MIEVQTARGQAPSSVASITSRVTDDAKSVSAVATRRSRTWLIAAPGSSP